MGSLRRQALAVAVLVAGLSAGTAAAASLTVSSEHVTIHTASVSISPLTCTLSSADADSDVSELLPLTNFGSDANLDVRSLLGDNERAFVQFDLAPCGITANALVTAASLDLFLYTAPAANAEYDAHRVTASWAETAITWLSQPSVAATATSSVSTGTTPNVTLSWDVASDVQAFVDGVASNGWRIADGTEGSLSAREGQFRSAEFGTASEQPILSITYYP